MTEDAFLISPMNSRTNGMSKSFRPCNRGIPLFIVIGIIFFFGLVIFLDRNKWQSTEETVQNLANIVVDQGEMIDQLYQNYEKIPKDNHINRRNGPTIFGITPTFARPVQKAELTRLAQSFTLVPNFYWILVEDSATKTKLVTNFLKESGLVYKHLNVPTPINYKLSKNDPNWIKPRGVAQRNEALKWIRENFNHSTNGVVYFADDDNTYSTKLFEEMEKIKMVGVWPVGLVGGLMVEKPICDNATKKVTGFNSVWKPHRVFPVDMAAFAINLHLILDKKDVWFSFTSTGGYQESAFLEQMVTRDQLEPLADCCTKVYVWHTRTESPQLNQEEKLKKKGLKSNADIEV